jgi:hypothetical protein
MVKAVDYGRLVINVTFLTVFVSLIFDIYSFSAVVQLGLDCLLGMILCVYGLSVLLRA